VIASTLAALAVVSCVPEPPPLPARGALGIVVTPRPSYRDGAWRWSEPGVHLVRAGIAATLRVDPGGEGVAFCWDPTVETTLFVPALPPGRYAAELAIDGYGALWSLPEVVGLEASLVERLTAEGVRLGGGRVLPRPRPVFVMDVVVRDTWPAPWEVRAAVALGNDALGLDVSYEVELGSAEVVDDDLRLVPGLSLSMDVVLDCVPTSDWRRADVDGDGVVSEAEQARELDDVGDDEAPRTSRSLSLTERLTSCFSRVFPQREGELRGEP